LYPTPLLMRCALMYDCSKCPGFCCSYQIIPLTKRDVERLAAHFGLSVTATVKKFTIPRDDEEFTMRRKADEHFGKVCRFFDTEARRCTIYEARPSICRRYPTGARCGYYDFLAFERRGQEDPELIATTWNS